MADTTRAKFRCQTVTRSAASDARQYVFTPCYDPSVPEDQRFAMATPSGRLELVVDNPAVEYELGADYYLDLSGVAAA